MSSTFDIYDLDDRELAKAAQVARVELATQRDYLAAIDAEISKRQSDVAADVMAREGKHFGSLAFAHSGMKFKAEARKTVEWDNAKLKELAAQLPWQQVERLFEIEFRIPERIYNAVIDPELLAKINAARTTKIADLKVSFVGFDVGNGDRA